TTLSLLGGTRSITAVYGGDGNFAGSTVILTQVVNPGSTTTAISSSLNPSNYGDTVTFTATVSPVPPAFGTATGTVTFKDGTATLGTGTVNGSGQATFTVSTLAIGGHTITAGYGGDTNLSGSTSASLSQTVNPAVTTTTLTSSVNPTVYGQPV